MSRYSVADAKNGLPSLIDRAMAGDEVVITRHGKPVVELRPVSAPAPHDNGMAWLRARRVARPSTGISSVELLRQMYEDDD
ncbi:MAG: type II toxin-antitoxin system prevent-host-death family antitoxin [Sandarakinorhabdus sp.]|nr:type II toxin-antitoxin system prevent-host-death family antitoxin [Sandarakinorhabdus sp.]